MNPEYIIVQAGGKGSRMGYLTANVPKALVPVDNLPMLFHLFRRYPEKKYVIIGDYQYDVLRRYLETFADVQYLLVNAAGDFGTCAGIRAALEKIPDGKSFLMIWSDLLLGNEFRFPEQEGNYVGISGSFPCRWSYQDGIFQEMPSKKHGVAGLFLFQEKSCLEHVPLQGEFVRWLKREELVMGELLLTGTREFGLLEEYQKLEKQLCRPFNRVRFLKDRVLKEGLDEQGKRLAVRERAWYKKAMELGFRQIPQIYGLEPLDMERISGNALYRYVGLLREDKERILKRLISGLKELHALETCERDYFSTWEAYAGKTFVRLDKVRNLIPFADERYIVINGRRCRNVFFFRKELEEKIFEMKIGDFCLLHGDCTFSNIVLRQDMEPVFIDPRGYFGYMELYGDPDYDWAKLYYSIVGNYDRFNRKEFLLSFGAKSVQLAIESNQWEDMEETFFRLLGEEVSPEKIRLLHGIIWLSLTTYAWEDYNSICGAFYNGLYYLEELW